MPRPGQRPARRGGRPRQGAGVDLGTATPDTTFPRLHADTDRLLAADARSFWTIDSTPESPDTPIVEASGWGPVVGDGEGLGQPAERAARRAVPRRRRRRRRRLGRRACADLLLDHGLDFPIVDGESPTSTEARRPRRRRPAAPRLSRSRRPSWRSSPRATSPAGDAPTAGRGRGAGRASASSRTSSPATTSCTTSTASASTRAWSSARSAASSATTCCSPTRAATSCTCRPTRSTRCASTSAARRRRCTGSAARDFAKAKSRVRSARARDRPGARRALPEAGQRRGPRVRARHAVAGRDGGRPSRTSRRPTSARRSTT